MLPYKPLTKQRVQCGGCKCLPCSNPPRKIASTAPTTPSSTKSHPYRNRMPWSSTWRRCQEVPKKRLRMVVLTCTQMSWVCLSVKTITKTERSYLLNFSMRKRATERLWSKLSTSFRKKWVVELKKWTLPCAGRHVSKRMWPLPKFRLVVWISRANQTLT